MYYFYKKPKFTTSEQVKANIFYFWLSEKRRGLGSKRILGSPQLNGLQIFKIIHSYESNY